MAMALRCGVVMFCAFALEIVNYATVNDDIKNDLKWSTQMS